MIPVFSTVNSPGTNATFTIVKWVGVRVMDANLKGKDWYVYIQPASFVVPHTIRVSDGSQMPIIQEDTVFAGKQADISAHPFDIADVSGNGVHLHLHTIEVLGKDDGACQGHQSCCFN